MNKINLETFKKLLNVKKGGAEFFRLVVKIVVWILVLGAIVSIIYSLDEIQKVEKARLGISVQEYNIAVLKTERQCESSVLASIPSAVKRAEESGKKVTEEERKVFIQASYNQCLFLNGLNIPEKKKEVKK